MASERVTFEQVVVPEIDVLYRVALRLTGHASDAEDLVQETLLRSWRAIDSFDGRHPRAWLLTIMRNAHVNSGRRRRPGLLSDPANQPEDPRDAMPSAEEVVVESYFSAELETGLAGLPASFREAVLLVDVSGLTYAEAAGVLDIPEGTLMSRLHRARKRLRRHLGADTGGAR